MKHTLCTILFILFCSFGVYGQLYVQARGGTGPTNVRIHAADKEPRSNSAVSYFGELGIGRQWGNVLLNTGIGFLTTGRNVTYTYWINSPEKPGTHEIATARKAEYYEHITVPLNVGYTISLSERLSLVPAIGVEGSYNVSARLRQVDKINMANVYHIRIFDLEHTYAGDGLRPFNKYSLWCRAQLDLAYNLSPRISIVAGADYHRMLTNLIDAKGYHEHIFPQSMYNYALLVNLGLRVSLGENSSVRRWPMSSCGRW